MPGEQLLILSNPRGRRMPRRNAKGRFVKGGAARASNPRRAHKRKAKRKGRARSTAVARRSSYPMYRRNPRGGFLAVLTNGALPAAVGAGGALAADFALSYLPLPENLRAGAMRHVSRAAAAVLLGGAASYLVKPALALQIGTGALTVAFHGAFKDALTRFLPAELAARLGDYENMDLGIYTGGPAEPGVAAFERRLADADYNGSGMSAFEHSMNGLADSVEL